MLARVLLLLTLVLPLPALAQLRWQSGKHFIVLPNGTTAETRPGRIEVAEVFSYGCIHCYRAQAEIEKLKAALPADAYLTYVHASFAPTEAWPMFQRAWYTAQAMRIGEANHHNMFSAVWENQQVGLLDPKTGLVRKPLPSIEEAARFYARAGKVKQAEFLKVANSAAVNAEIKRADQLVASWRIPGTPSIVVNGRYLINNEFVIQWDEIRALTLFLVTQERQRLNTLKAQPGPSSPAAKKP